ncbi:hypothetical protein NC653_026602 [Populus alba x Populus x berolinensis]|uniref:Uncharacterized protein n=1 Tax=Populus alba x Populus x berolinensis TaxID=444605 RepID=A0AAD6MFG7_9ROSI|nr:hypothetical protein NC653_026602 [Populus alba x Populus x berolinensis]
MCFPLTSDKPTYPNVATGTADIAFDKERCWKPEFQQRGTPFVLNFSFLCNFEEGGTGLALKQSNALVCLCC